MTVGEIIDIFLGLNKNTEIFLEVQRDLPPDIEWSDVEGLNKPQPLGKVIVKDGKVFLPIY